VRLRPFELIQPERVADAVAALGRAGGEARLIAGGTALVPMMRLGLVGPEVVISLHRVPELDAITTEAGALRLGAMATVADVHRAPAVRSGWSLLADAAGRVATPAIRSSATLGGNLAYAEAASDPAPALLCLDAEVEIAGPTGERILPLSGFFTGFYETALEPGEILTAVRVPAGPAGARAGYIKFCPRSAEDKPLVGVAAVLVLDAETGRCRHARIAMGGVAPTAIRAARAESLLDDQLLDAGTIREAADVAAAEADPLSDLMGSADYRREMTRVWIRRLLTRLGDDRPPGPASHHDAARE
jgi:aerobic carbon-monoxide dehydrogenase medium subunit